MELILDKKSFKFLQKLSPENGLDCRKWQVERLFGNYETFFICRQTAPCYNTMEVGMELYSASPRMQDGGKAGLSPKVFLVAGKGEESLAGCLKEQVIQLNGVGKNQGIEFGR
jgi:hypothetical protein